MIQRITNPLFLFLAIWGAAVAMYLAGIWAGTFPVPRPVLWATVLLSVGGFCLGYMTWAAFRCLLPPVGPAPSRTSILTPERIARGLQFTGLMGLIALSLGLYRIAVIASRFDVSVSALLSDPDMLRMRLVTFIMAGLFETDAVVMLISITNSLFSIGFVLLGVFLHVGTTKTRYAYLGGFLLISLAIGITNLSRYETTVNVLYLVLAYGLVCSLDRHAEGRRLLRILVPLAAIFALFFVIDVLLHKSAEYGRLNRLHGFLYHLYWYIASPLAAFNEFLVTFDGRHDHGLHMFFPFYKWLCRFGLTPEVDISLYNEFVLLPHAANVYTWLRSLYEDFGLFGVTAAPYALGLAVSALKPRATAYFQHLNLYLVLLVFAFFSFYNYFMFSNQVYLQILFGFLLFRYELPNSAHRSFARTGTQTRDDVCLPADRTLGAS
jgi:oligosaccharide repeat unit polymerase